MLLADLVPEDPAKLRLSQIDTRWSLVDRAHQGEGDVAAAARSELMIRYAGAVHHYLLRVSRDPEDAADLTQEFSLRFLRGDFRRADPKSGRFRNYVKAALLNLLADSRRKRKNQPQPLPGDGEWLADPTSATVEADAAFLECWRNEILRRAWDRLALHEDRTGQPFFTVLRFRSENPTLHSPEIAARLSAILQRSVNAGWVRQNLLRARDRFVDHVRAEVAHSLGNPSRDDLEDEMNDLGLQIYCRPERPLKSAEVQSPDDR